MERNQFIFFRSFWETIENLPTNKEKLQAYEALCSYALTGEEPELRDKKPSVAIVFRIAKPIIQHTHERGKMTAIVNRDAPIP